MTKAFKVAEHIFHLQLPDDSPLWPMLGQYDPFEVAPVDNPVFVLKLVDELPELSLETVYDVPVEPGETVVKLYRCGDVWQFEVAPTDKYPIIGRIRVCDGFTRGELNIARCRVQDAVFCVNNALMLMFAFRTSTLGTLEMHASVIRNSGKGFLFLAKSGTGKSTHSSLWLKHIPGSELLNDDNPVVRVWPDGSVVVYGSPWSGKTPCYKNIQCPVGAFVRIRRAPENKINRLSVLESYALLYSSSSGFKADREMGDGLHSSLEAAVLNAPCYVLDCRPDEEAAIVCSKEVLGNGSE